MGKISSDEWPEWRVRMAETPNLRHLEIAIIEQFGIKLSKVYFWEGSSRREVNLNFGWVSFEVYLFKLQFYI